ncbi:GntR family transcriptional regulator [Jatrophihabitans endophyticus]|uniref:GntR family transcriptional regulator n=1 Tax=Jatrophihabitans endophyticus TaxID=1206085 RepID=UPI0026EFFA08|nr:GntR family transcriptional regulator [Jatrophihabitans endophyticus]
MILNVDTNSPTPPYEQIRAQVAELAGTEALPPGTRLPTIRQLANDLGLAPGTIARAYRELEAAGVVISRVRHGTTIAERAKPSRRETSDRLAAAAHAYALTVAALGVSDTDAVRAVEQRLQVIRG